MRINILPDGCTDFIFTLGEATQTVDGRLTMKPYRSYFIGPMNSYSELVAYAETVHMLSPFSTFRIITFHTITLHELTNQRICADEVTNFFDASLQKDYVKRITLETE